jgi:aminomethyltransferase
VTDSAAALKTTPLHALHQSLGAKLVPFAGYEMPVQYPLGVLKEHQHTRSQAGLFDVSHMGQIKLSGDAVREALEALVPVDIVDLPEGMQRYALFTNDQGGILDDLMVTNCGDHLLLVVNAACKEADAEHLRQHLPESVSVEELPDQALLALQGPAARTVMKRLAPAAAELIFMHTANVQVAAIDCFVSCSGYTGEDGYEISVAAENAEALAKALLAEPEVEAIGLGARDSLRLEAGLCLYGHDINTETTPIEASLLWAISKARRPGGGRAGGYPGADRIAQQIEQGGQRKRLMLKPTGRAPVREGAVIVNEAGEQVGEISSGGFGPSVGGPVAMGYVQVAASEGLPLFANVRNKLLPLEVVKGAFIQQRYYRG